MKKTYKPIACKTCGENFVRTGPSGAYCSLRCLVLGNTDVKPEPDQCWPWVKSFNTKGYGDLKKGDGPRAAHRAMFSTIYNEELDHHDIIMHICDNPPCCNPFHLKRGTQIDNIRDMLSKGRGNNYQNMAKGSKHAMATIDENMALKIFQAPGTGRQIAETLGVSKYIVEKIKCRKSWRHVTAGYSG